LFFYLAVQGEVMNSILGRIAKVDEATPQATHNGAHLKIQLEPLCLLPQRTPVPEWLKEQKVWIERQVSDAREIGGLGDSVVLTGDESAPLLYPLEVQPPVAHGEIPPHIELQLRWWKDETPPEYSVRANGQLRTGTWTRNDEIWTATVECAGFFDFAPQLPVTFEVTCDKWHGTCVVLPQQGASAAKVILPQGEVHRVENQWYAVDVSAKSHGGAISALRERSRGVDYFRSDDVISSTLEYGSHTDRFKTGWGDWSDKMSNLAMATGGTRRQSSGHAGASTRLAMSGVVDEGEGLHTSASYTFHDELPLIVLQREYSFVAKKDEKEDALKQPIDALHPLRLSFRAAAKPERKGHIGSRVLCADGERLSITRPAQHNEMVHHAYWTMRDGWAILEHPLRREYLMYCFDTQSAPNLVTWFGEHVITLEPQWQFAPVRTGESFGYTLALSAGELCGAAPQGAWVACRAQSSGSVRYGVVARLRETSSDATAIFSSNGQTREVPLQRVLVSGVGELFSAVVEMQSTTDDALDISVAGIPSRREQ
jgi:hypothetical protein